MKVQWKDVAIPMRPRTCWYQQGKICYDKKGAVSAKNARFKKDKVSLRAYWCGHCNFWHLTKNINYKLNEQKQAENVV